jgi:hypothetical protein
MNKFPLGGEKIFKWERREREPRLRVTPSDILGAFEMHTLAVLYFYYN